MARDHLLLDASGYSVLMMCFGVGALMGAILIAGNHGHVPRGVVLTFCSIALGVAIFVFGLSISVPLSGAMLFVSGLTMMGNNALINGMVQERVPDALRARVMGLYITVYIGAHPIGAALSGWCARNFGVSLTVATMGALLFIAATWVFRRYPELRGA